MGRPVTPITRSTLKEVLATIEEEVDPDECVFQLAEVQGYFQSDIDRLLDCCADASPVAMAEETDRAWYVADWGFLGWSTVLDQLDIDDDPMRLVIRRCHHKQAVADGVEVGDDPDLYIVRKNEA